MTLTWSIFCNQENIVWSTRNPFSSFRINNFFSQIPLPSVFEVAFYYQKQSALHFTIRNTVPYNKPLTNRACSGRTGEYWPSRSVSKRLILWHPKYARKVSGLLRNKPQVIFFFFLTGEGERSFPIQTIFFLVDVAQNTFNGSLHGHYRRKQMRANYSGSRIVNNVWFQCLFFFFFDKVSAQGYTIHFRRPKLNFLHISKVVKILIQWSLSA